MNIDISPKEYWKKMPYHEALLYCQLLVIDGKNDWRMLKNSIERVNHLGLVDETLWNQEDIDEFPSLLEQNYTIIPVRDI